jgi:hypothetical protein
MSIDSVGRAAAADARRKATREVDPTMMLQRLHRTRRTRMVGWAVAAAAVIAAGAIVLVNSGVLAGDHSPQPASRPHPTATASACPVNVTCLGGNRYRMNMQVPMVITLPANFGPLFNTISTQSEETYRTNLDATGVTVFENAVPIKYDNTWTPDQAAGTTAASMAAWLAHRPFFDHTTITTVTVGGRPAYRITAQFRPGAATPATWTGDPHVAPIFAVPAGGFTTAAWTNTTIAAEFYLLNLPHNGVTVIWSWSQNGSSQLVANRPFIDTLSFG